MNYYWLLYTSIFLLNLNHDSKSLDTRDFWEKFDLAETQSSNISACWYDDTYVDSVTQNDILFASMHFSTHWVNAEMISSETKSTLYVIPCHVETISGNHFHVAWTYADIISALTTVSVRGNHQHGLLQLNENSPEEFKKDYENHVWVQHRHIPLWKTGQNTFQANP